MLYKTAAIRSRCLHVFSTQQHLEAHRMYCRGITEKPQHVMSAKDKNILKLTSHHKEMVPYIQLNTDKPSHKGHIEV